MLAAIVAGVVMAALFALITLIFVANQVASGLALTLFGLGLSGLIGEALCRATRARPRAARYPGPFRPAVRRVGSSSASTRSPTSALALAIGVWLVPLPHARAGLILRAIGDNHTSAHALGYSVMQTRFLAVLFGGACAGLAGGYLSLVYTPQWAQAMTAGRGWIALALVVFATWLPGRVVLGALLFGAVSILQLHAQAFGVGVPSQFLSALPYLTTVIVLVIISRNRTLLRVNTPACLGQPFVPDR